MGVSAMGSSIGGTIFPIATHKLIPLVGWVLSYILDVSVHRSTRFPWTMRICAFMLMCTLGFANLTLVRRLPPKNVQGGLFNLRAFRSAPFTIYCLSGFVAFLGLFALARLSCLSDPYSSLGLYTVLTYIDLSAIRVGVSPDFSFYLVSISNGCSLFGRVAGGIGSDRIGECSSSCGHGN